MRKPPMGHPGIDPAVYLKDARVGFFENTPSEWEIASRCSDLSPSAASWVTRS